MLKSTRGGARKGAGRKGLIGGSVSKQCSFPKPMYKKIEVETLKAEYTRLSNQTAACVTERDNAYERNANLTSLNKRLAEVLKDAVDWADRMAEKGNTPWQTWVVPAKQALEAHEAGEKKGEV